MLGRWRERAETFYEEDRKEYPDRRMIGTENPSAGGHTRRLFTGGDGLEITQLPHCIMKHYGVTRPAMILFPAIICGPALIIWEKPDGRDAARHCGPLDTAGFRKDTFYYFRSIWNTKEITLHLAPQWNFEGAGVRFINR